jgi:hypothetical protein
MFVRVLCTRHTGWPLTLAGGKGVPDICKHIVDERRFVPHRSTVIFTSHEAQIELYHFF